MNPSVIPAPKSRVLSARRVILLATTIASLGAAALVVAPGLNLTGGYPAARQVETGSDHKRGSAEAGDGGGKKNDAAGRKHARFGSGNDARVHQENSISIRGRG